MAYLFFAEGAGLDATGDAAVYPHENFTGIDPISNATATISFKARNGTAVDDTVLVTYATTANGGGYKKFAAAFTKLLCQLNNTQSKEMVVVADEDNSIYFDSIISGTVTITTVA
jgi:hypothetical protein